MSFETTIIEDLPVGERAQELIHAVNQERYMSKVKRMGGQALFHELRSGSISHTEYDLINDELSAKKKLLSPKPVQEPPVDEPELYWSPTMNLPDEPVERERDFRERAFKD